MTKRFHRKGAFAATLIAALLVTLAFAACSNIGGADTPAASDESVATTEAGASAPASVSAITPAAVDEITPAAADAPVTPSASAVDAEQPTSAPAVAQGEDKDKSDGESANSGKKKNEDKAGDSGKNSTKPDKKKRDTSKDSDKPAKNEKSKPQDDETITVSIAVDCLTLFDGDPALAEQVSSDGVMLSQKDVTVKVGASVYDVLKASGVAFVGKAYISSIRGLSEGDGGSKSGWLYNVNGVYPSIGVTKHTVESGDSVQFRYTLDGGKDVR
ncbi:MAG: DUF4430 domain-containing protein [Clostridiales Family XIII bacterium]|jgi:type IV secretory pathway VirB10-like protein|nr:DUF4430 domain-containing protein [Clostridiales Family XIII bacterium]